MGRIVMFTTASCQHCKRALGVFNQLDAPVHEVNLMKYPARRAEMIQLCGKRTVPQIFFNKEHIGGADDVEALHRDGALAGKVAACLAGPDDGPEPSPEPTAEQQKENADREDVEFDLLFTRMHANKGAALGVKDRRYRMKIIKRCFKAATLIEWLKTDLSLDATRAQGIAARMHKLKYFYRVDSSTDTWCPKGVFRFFQDKDRRTLNMARVWDRSQRPASEAAADIVSTLLLLQDRYFTKDGKGIDYEGIKGSDEFVQYRIKALEMQRVDIAGLTPVEKMAFFINVYNALVIHANVERGAPKNGLERNIFFNSVGYTIGGHKYTLNDIENGILRANQKAVGALFQPFGKKDPRGKLSISRFEFDPRIHFALVCGAKSCPPVRVFLPENLNDALQMATEGFVNEEVLVKPSKKAPSGRKVQLSMLFKWYAKDFGGSTGAILEWIQKFHFDPEYHKLLQEVGPSSVKVSYATYDWNPNNRSYDDEPPAEPTAQNSIGTDSSIMTMSQMSSDLISCTESGFDASESSGDEE